jgi:hypothetical protein
VVRGTLFFCLAFMGALGLTEAEKEGDDLFKICEKYHNGEGLTKGPCVVDLDNTVVSRRVSPYLDDGQGSRIKIRNKSTHSEL